jgi:hypothetical protein
MARIGDSQYRIADEGPNAKNKVISEVGQNQLRW